MIKKQKGVALLVVLLIVAVIAVIAADITGRNQLSVRRTMNLTQYDQAYWYAISAEELAKKVLKQDMDDADGTVHLQQYWALADVVFPAEYGEIGGEMKDLRSCFNLNALSQPSEENENGQPKMPLPTRQFQALLVALGMDDFMAESLSHTVKDYLDEDTVASPFGAEDSEYESRTVPYRAANTLMNDKSELRAVMGVTQEVYQALAPYVCVIPGNSDQVLNINTVDVEQAALLAAMFDNQISVGEAENLIGQRPAAGYENLEDFWTDANPGAGVDAKMKSSIVVDSKYFLLHAGARVDNAIFQMESVLKNSGGQFKVVTRQFGAQNKTEDKQAAEEKRS
ncbi:type II secretion system minor pseudopilin GspK [Shewanella corallii]|uniref:Type II secretion system protein K n=1 Tax=Shewanella corallii TaxID=560080 RepID=A0ABT0NE93_9GAMM|nr:type II secretion system minor pseudopilin GspK [Shewanella corallii]MCL2916171.1 type II secretion system minor pseudopilin GspK [Shewanella corallii]